RSPPVGWESAGALRPQRPSEPNHVRRVWVLVLDRAFGVLVGVGRPSAVAAVALHEVSHPQAALQLEVRHVVGERRPFHPVSASCRRASGAIHASRRPPARSALSALSGPAPGAAGGGRRLPLDVLAARRPLAALAAS